MERARVKKVGHTKSRTGCLTCRRRRVKCDEVRPACGVCSRLALDCNYNSAAHTPSPPKNGWLATLSEMINNATKAGDGSEVGPFSARECKARRLTELRLFHHWMSINHGPMQSDLSRRWRDLWYKEIPHLALEHDNILYALLALSATRLLVSGPERDELIGTRDFYWNLALVEQQKAITVSASAESLVISALLISINTLAQTLQGDQDHYLPPSVWLHTGRGAWVFLNIGDRGSIPIETALGKLTSISALVWDECHASYDPDIDAELLPQPLSISLIPTTQSQDSFMRVARYVHLFKRAFNEREPSNLMIRRFFMFPGSMSDGFLQHVREQDARALLLVGQLFQAAEKAQLVQYYFHPQKEFSLQRDIDGIRSLVPSEWRSYIK
ncbi:hypothetical protein ANO11243_096300 [Dothideomycetidae sp. 11243]|nr:hypothetical protein ANO11243_096300 [fungal sp. No.11243]